MTYDGLTLKLYLNGTLESSQTVGGPVNVSTEEFRIGGYNSGPWTMNGVVDEIALYGRALSEAEILAIYNAGAAGKCRVPTPPAIVTQPESRTVVAGDSVMFSVTASGTPPLAYQWSFNGTFIQGATNAT
jgi:hypothetical protein